MGISLGRSIVHMPDMKRPYPSLLAFLVGRFPHISEITWEERIISGKVFAEGGVPVSLATPYTPNGRLFYYREVAEEPIIPFEEHILYRSEHLIVVCKPHFLPVTPGGPYVTETLINRLKESTGNHYLSPINRIDRETAGIVLISAKKESRGLYQKLFMDGAVSKTYHAVVTLPEDTAETEWIVENRIEQGEPWFRMKSCAGQMNACSKISLLKTNGVKALLQLCPVTGKKHQLRIHSSELGMPILGDRYYPILLEKAVDNYQHPLHLLAKKIEFQDPISGMNMSFESKRELRL